jgi:WD40 repeat protein
LWASARDRRPLSELANTGSPFVGSIAFSPDGSTVAAGDDTGAVRIWDVNSRSLVGVVTRRATGVDRVTFTDDAHVVAASRAHTYDAAGLPLGSASTVAFDRQSLRAVTCAIVGRGLSASERVRFDVAGDGDECDG